MIDTSGKWWKGNSFEDLKQYLISLNADGYPIDEIHQSLCACGNKTFRIKFDRDEGFSQRICTWCESKAYIADSEEYIEDVRPKKLNCIECKNDEFIIAIAFSFRKNKGLFSLLKKQEIIWITQGEMCVSCGILGSCVDWHISYAPSRHLLKNI